MRILFLLPLCLLFAACAHQRSSGPSVISRKEILPAKKFEKIVIDAGHGGKDPGSSNNRLYEEKKLTLATARHLKECLEKMGYTTQLTREDDTYVPLSTRTEVANTGKGVLFVSVHFNHAPDPKAEGVEVFYYKDDREERRACSKRLGEEVLAKVIWHTGAQSRGVKTANFAVIRETKMPAVLIECGFLSNPHEREKIHDPQYIRFLALGIAKGIDQYLKKI